MKQTKIAKRFLVCGLALSMVVSGSGMTTNTAQAAKKKTTSKKNTKNTKNKKKAVKPALSKKKASFEAGKTVTLTVKNATKNVKWSVSKKKIAKVTETSGSKKNIAVIKGLKKGKVVVVAKVGKKKLKCKVTVKKPVPNFKKVSVDKYDTSCLILNLKKKDSTLKTADITVTAKIEKKGKFNNQLIVYKLLKESAKKYRVYLENRIGYYQSIQVTSGVSKASTIYKPVFYADETANDYYAESGSSVCVALESYFSGGVGTKKVTIKKGKLPEGLTLDASHSCIKGIVSAAGTTSLTLEGKDELGRKAQTVLNIKVYDANTLAVNDAKVDIKYDREFRNTASAIAQSNQTEFDEDKVYCNSDSLVVAPKGGSGKYTFKLNESDNPDVRLSTDAYSNDAAKTLTQKIASTTTLKVPYSITPGKHTYTVTVTDTMDPARTAVSTITVNVVKTYSVIGSLKSKNGKRMTGTRIVFISTKAKDQYDSEKKYYDITDDEDSDADQTGMFSCDLPEGTYIVKAFGDVQYQATQKVVVKKSDVIKNLTIAQDYYVVSGKITYANKENVLDGKKVFFEPKNLQYECGDYISTYTMNNGEFTVALPSNTYVAYILDEKGNRKYIPGTIVVNGKDVILGAKTASIARYKVEGVVFDGTAVDPVSTYAQHLAGKTLYFYNPDGDVVTTYTDENGAYKIYLEGEKTYVVKTYIDGVLRNIGTVTVAKENIQNANLTYTKDLEITGAVELKPEQLGTDITVNSNGINDIIYKFVPTENMNGDITVDSALQGGVKVSIYNEYTKLLDSYTFPEKKTSDDDDADQYVPVSKLSYEFLAGKTYYIKLVPVGDAGKQQKGEFKFKLTKEVILPTETPEPSITPDPTETEEPVYTPDPAETEEPVYTPDPTETEEPVYTPEVIDVDCDGTWNYISVPAEDSLAINLTADEDGEYKVTFPTYTTGNDHFELKVGSTEITGAMDATDKTVQLVAGNNAATLTIYDADGNMVSSGLNICLEKQ